MSEKSCDTSKCACSKTVLKVIVGVVFIVLGVSAVILWWPSLISLIKGCVGLFLIMVGAITIAIAKG